MAQEPFQAKGLSLLGWTSKIGMYENIMAKDNSVTVTCQSGIEPTTCCIAGECATTGALAHSSGGKHNESQHELALWLIGGNRSTVTSQMALHCHLSTFTSHMTLHGHISTITSHMAVHCHFNNAALTFSRGDILPNPCLTSGNCLSNCPTLTSTRYILP